MMTKRFMLSILIIITVVFIGLIVFTMIRYSVRSKRNKEASRANEMIFLAKFNAQRKANANKNSNAVTGTIECEPERKLSDFAQRPYSAEPVEETVVEDVPVIPEEPPVTGKLSDFFDAD